MQAFSVSKRPYGYAYNFASVCPITESTVLGFLLLASKIVLLRLEVIKIFIAKTIPTDKYLLMISMCIVCHPETSKGVIWTLPSNKVTTLWSWSCHDLNSAVTGNIRCCHSADHHSALPPITTELVLWQFCAFNFAHCPNTSWNGWT